MSVYLNYHYPRGTNFLNQIGNLNNSNHNKGKINKNNFWKEYSNDITAIAGKAKTSIISGQSSKIYSSQNYYNNFSDKYNSDINNNKYSYSSNYNNYGLLSKPSNKNANSVNQYIDTRKLSYNNDINNNTNNNNNNKNLNSIILSKVGLQNIGNTCFMNTSLQILIHSDDFIQRLIEKYPTISKKARITQNFFHLCESIASSQSLSSITPSDFKYQFGSSHSLFRGYGQNDTQEFFRILLEDMNKELNEVPKKQPYKELDTKGKSKMQCDKEYDKLFRGRESSIVMDSFYGQIINIFICKCNKISYSFEKILDLPLLLNKSNMYVSIEQLLDDYFQEEEIYFEAKCEECKKKRYHTKKVKFSQPPNILILSLQRINWKTKRKNDCMVDFSEQLYIKQYIDEECGHGNEYKYSLYAIGNHSGSINFGHYYAYIKLNDTTWYEFNDSTVRKLGNIKTRSSAAYTLFYKKII